MGRRVLVDENLPHKLRLHLSGHEAVTVAFAGMDGLKNGQLLRAAEDAGFEVFLTADKAMPYQQNMAGRKIAIVALSGRYGPSSRSTCRGFPKLS
jgi:hypothetical protein